MKCVCLFSVTSSLEEMALKDKCNFSFDLHLYIVNYIVL